MSIRTRGRTLGVGVAVFAGFSLTSTILVAVTTPGWARPTAEAPLHPGAAYSPQPLPDRGWRQDSAELPSDGETLRAWLVRPIDAAAPVPGVVLVPGAGAGTRDRMLSEAQSLAEAGIASISYDKRRTGYSVVSRDFDRLARDARRAADLLAGAQGVDPMNIGVLGWSEGGWVAPIAVAQEPNRFAFLALASAPIVTPLEQVAWMVFRRLTSALDWLRRTPAAVLASGRGTLDFLEFDVRAALRKTSVPVYAVWGEADPMVPVRSAVRRMRQSATDPTTAVVVSGAGHRPPADSGWIVGLASWIRSPAATSSLTGAEPPTVTGIATTPRTSTLNQPIWSILGAAALRSRCLGGVRRTRTPSGSGSSRRGRSGSAGRGAGSWPRRSAGPRWCSSQSVVRWPSRPPRSFGRYGDGREMTCIHCGPSGPTWKALCWGRRGGVQGQTRAIPEPSPVAGHRG